MNSTTLNPHTAKKTQSFGFTLEATTRVPPENDSLIKDAQNLNPSLLLLHRATKHHP
jgi:hypothetical protein